MRGGSTTPKLGTWACVAVIAASTVLVLYAVVLASLLWSKYGCYPF